MGEFASYFLTNINFIITVTYSCRQKLKVINSLCANLKKENTIYDYGNKIRKLKNNLSN